MGKPETAYATPTRVETDFTQVTKQETSHTATPKVESSYVVNTNAPTPDTYNDATLTYNDATTYYIGHDPEVKNSTKLDNELTATVKPETSFAGGSKNETSYQ